MLVCIDCPILTIDRILRDFGSGAQCPLRSWLTIHGILVLSILLSEIGHFNVVHISRFILCTFHILFASILF